MTGRNLIMTAAAISFCAFASSADVNIEFRTAQSSYAVGEEVIVDLYAVSDHPTDSEALSVMEVIWLWPASSLQLIALEGEGEAPLLFEGFLVAGSGGLNETDLPTDGDALYYAWAQLGSPVLATPQGTRITSLRFQAIAANESATFDIGEVGGTPERMTYVASGIIPNKIITGLLTSVTISIGPVMCGPADVNADGRLDFFDVQLFLDSFASQQPLADFASPIGVFDFFDVLTFLDLFSQGCP